MPERSASTIQQNFKSFSTRHVLTHERIDYWEAHNNDALIGLDIRTLNGQTLIAEQHNRLLPTIRAAKVRGSSQLVERTPEMIRKYPTDEVALFFCLQGDSFFCDQNGTQVLHAGQVLACNADTTFIRGFGSGVSEMVLTIQMEEFIKLSGGDSLTAPKKFAFGPSLENQPSISPAKLLASWVDEATDINNTSTTLSRDDCLSWVEMLFRGAEHDDVQLYEAAQQSIHLNLSNPNFRRADIAHRLQISERQVARLFSGRNTSFSREVTLRRIEAARGLLDAEPHTPVSSIARRCGFRSPAHFSRTFREVLGCTPSQLRSNNAHLFTT